MDPEITRITDFWYNRSPRDWFMTPEGLDKECHQNFGTLVQRARANELDEWTSTTNGTLALLILLDQFPRNIFRNLPEAFSSDTKAFGIAANFIAKGQDKEVSSKQALTLYLPLMHHESLISQVAGVALLENLLARSHEEGEDHDFLKNSVTAAKGHLKVIQMFGRFPARNKALGRQSTPEEEAYMEKYPHGLPPVQNSSNK